MYIKTLVVGDYDTNCYILTPDSSIQAIVIDPADEPDVILDAIAEKGLDVKYIILTHGHWDHFGAAKYIAEKTGAKIGIHKLDKKALSDSDLSMAFIFVDHLDEVKPDMELSDGQVLKLGDLDAIIIHTPGHTPGGISILIDDCLFTGDLIFKGSVGRTDLTGGSYETLLNSVKEKVLVLPDRIKIYPGHGPATTIGNERRQNPFLIGL